MAKILIVEDESSLKESKLDSNTFSAILLNMNTGISVMKDYIKKEFDFKKYQIIQEIEKYQKEDKRIKLIKHKENKGK